MGNNNSTDSIHGDEITAKQVVESFGQGEYLKGKTALVTGGNSGIGLETCKVLCSAGARVIMCSRSVSSGEKAIETEIKKNGNGGYKVENPDIIVKALNLESLQSIHDFSKDILATESHIDYLILNAGIMALPNLERTEAGFEKQFGVNHMGHYYLTTLFYDKLLSQPCASRIVVLSSVAHSYGNVTISDLNFEKGRSYSPWIAYGQSKQANILFAKSLADKTKGTQVTALSVHPGVIRTNLYRSSIGLKLISFFVASKSIPQGAASTVWACLAPRAGLDELRGAYICDCAPKLPNYNAQDVTGTLREELWVKSKELLDAALERLNVT